MAKLSIRIDLDARQRVGPGKIALLEQVGAKGSISAAGRALGMSYRRAWELIDELNRMFGAPVLSATTGGRKGGGAALTAFGRALIGHYRAIEKEASAAARSHMAALNAELRRGKAKAPRRRG